MSRATQILEDLAAQHGEDMPLASSLFALALEEYPHIDTQPYLDRLDALAARVRALTARVGELQAVRQALFEEEGLRGNAEAYFDKRNSFLNEVMDRRLGLPITLSAIYVEVVRRAGGVAEGIGFPGHFLVGHEIAGRRIVVDPFHEGVVRTPDDLQILLARTAGEGAALQPWMTDPASGRTVVARVLNNLEHAYVVEEDIIGAVTALDRLLAVAPERQDSRRDRGLLYGQLGLANAALTDLRRYLEAQPEAEDAARIRALLPHLEERAGQLD